MEERIDSLHVSNLRIIQAKEAFCFGIDAVLLADLGYKYLEKDLGLIKLKVTDPHLRVCFPFVLSVLIVG